MPVRKGQLVGVEKRLSWREQRYADNRLEGKSNTQAAVEAYGYEDNRPLASNTGSRNLKRAKVIRYLDNQAHGAATRIVTISKRSRNETVKLNANKDILDRAQIGPRYGPVIPIQINIENDRREFGGGTPLGGTPLGGTPL